MGYEIKMYIGKASALEGQEWLLSKKKYKDGSGFEPLKDRDGSIKTTGRTEHWFQVFAMVDLCKLGYSDDALNRLISDSHTKAIAQDATDVHYFYGEDGNSKISDDKYGAPLSPVPLKSVLVAMNEIKAKMRGYRRTKWALALIESMQSDHEELSVMFYGH